MIANQIAARGVQSPHVLQAMAAVPRHRFVPAALRDEAYADKPLPIGHGQTISQPYIVARMVEAAGVGPGSRVLEVGVGSGYLSAVLLALGAEVWGIEIHAPLLQRARHTFAALGLAGPRLHLHCGDGYNGWPEAAPFDAIILSAAPKTLPPALSAQLHDGGRLVAPVGGLEQHLIRRIRRGTDWQQEELGAVRFVPMTGEAERPHCRVEA